MKTARNTLAAIVFLAVAAAFFASCRGKRPERFNLLLITLDTTRADSIGAYGNPEAATPNIDRLAQHGIRFRNCYAQVPLTLPSHCTLFTGRYPMAHGVRNNGTYFLPPEETTLAEILRAGGFRTFGCIASFTLLSKFGLAQGFEAYDETFQQRQTVLNFHDEVPADEISGKFSAWLGKNQGERFFTWLHFFDPHYPYRVHPELDARFARSERLKYEGEIAFVDLHVGRIVRQLESRGLLERTIIVIAGDHGEAFGEHQEFGHGVFCYEESLKVPLILYNPVLFPKGMDDRRPRRPGRRAAFAAALPGGGLPGRGPGEKLRRPGRRPEGRTAAGHVLREPLRHGGQQLGPDHGHGRRRPQVHLADRARAVRPGARSRRAGQPEPAEEHPGP